MKNLLFVLILTLLSCEGMMTTQNTKPTITTFNPPDSNVEVVSGDPQTNGYTDGVDYIAGANYNAFWRQAFRVADYLLNDERTLYVKCTSGNDSTGTGTSALPFKTISKACSMVAPNAFTSILLAEAGDYNISADIDLINKSIVIRQNTGITTADIVFDSYTDAVTKNEYYSFNLYQGSNLAIFARNIDLDDPDDALNDWEPDNGCIKVYDGLVNIMIAGSTGINFSNVAAAANDAQLIVSRLSATTGGIGIPVIQINGSITTNSKGYVVNAFDQLAMLNSYNPTIDDDDYWVTGIKSIPSYLIFNVSTYSVTEVSVGCAIHRIKTSGIDPTWSDSTQTLAAADSDGTIQTKIESLINDVYPEIPKTAITGTITRDGSGTKVLLITIAIDAEYAEYILTDPVLCTVGVATYQFAYTRGRKAYNIKSNILQLNH